LAGCSGHSGTGDAAANNGQIKGGTFKSIKKVVSALTAQSPRNKNASILDV
jgi:hypothetical protein